MTKRLLLKIALAGGSIVLAVLVLEAVLRLLGYSKGPASFYDQKVGFRYYPMQTRSMMGEGDKVLAEVRLNEMGLRGPWYPESKDPTKIRIACLGDSCTFGWPVEDHATYPIQLARKLEEVMGSGRAEVVNFGHTGYNTRNELRQYVELVRPWQPDIVILGYVFNDTQPEDFGPHYTDSFLFRLLGRTAMLEAFQRHIRPRSSFFRREDPPELKAVKQRYLEHRDVIMSDPDAEISRPFWSRSMEALADLVGEVRADGAKFLLIVFPKRDQFLKLQMARRKGLIAFDGMIRSRKLKAAARMDAAYIEGEIEKELRPQAFLARKSRMMGIPFLDLLPGFIARDEILFHPEDPGHPSSLGYEVTAEETAMTLHELGWLE